MNMDEMTRPDPEPRIYLTRTERDSDALAVVQEGVPLETVSDRETTRPAEERALRALVELGADAMEAKLIEKLRASWCGWDDPENADMLKRQLCQNILEGDWIDVANLALFLWNLEGYE